MTQQQTGSHQRPSPNANYTTPVQSIADEVEGWPIDPDRVPQAPEPITGPLPTSTRRGSGKRSSHEDWRQEREQARAERERQRQQEHTMQQRQEYLWRRQFEVRQERQRLDAEEQSLQQQWDTLPQSPSRLVRLIVVASILTIIIGGIIWYPALLIPLILVLLIVGGIRRHRRPAFRSRDANWTERERYRIQSRVAWIDARSASLAQEEQAISSELLALPTPQPDPEP